MEELDSESSDSDVSLFEQLLEEEDFETILIPREDVCAEVHIVPPQEASQGEADLGGTGYTNFFKDIVLALQGEDMIQRSPRGKMLHPLLYHIMHMDEKTIADVSIQLTAEVNRCIIAAKKQKLPSVAATTMWSAFHRLRSSKKVEEIWTSGIVNNVPAEHCKENNLALQLILERMLKKLIENEVKCDEHDMAIAQPLTLYESNAVRYMAGFVAVKLLKKCRKKAKHPLLRLKRELFVKVLTKMKASGHPGEPDVLTDYSSQWSELIDRGGLYHISSKVFNMFVSIELVVRQHMNRKHTPEKDLCAIIRQQIFACHSILTCWEDIASDIPKKYESYSIELLERIVSLWINIRGHSFAEGWTMNFERKYKKGTRKTLQPEKET